MSKLFGINEVCDYINKELKLTVTESVYPHHLQWWKRVGAIDYPGGKGKLVQIPEEQLKQLVKVAFFHIKLGVKLEKIKIAIDYLDEKTG